MTTDELRKYEAVVIFGANAGPQELKTGVQELETLLRNNGAAEVSVNQWGRRELAFPVKKNRFGSYVALQFSSANHAIIEKLHSNLRISERVIRFQTHRLNERTRKFKGSLRRGGEGFDEAGFLEEEV